MGYAATQQSFIKAKQYLDALKVSKVSIKWAAKDDRGARRIQYLIHQGLFAASRLRIPGYAHLKDEWSIKRNELIIIADLKEVIDTTSSLTFEGFHDAFAVCDKISQLLDTDFELVFIGAGLNTSELAAVNNYCKQNSRIAQQVEGNLHIRSANHEAA